MCCYLIYTCPGRADGFTVISAMRHKNPNAVTLLFTGYPALKEAMDAILVQVDEILVTPMPIPKMVALIRERLEKRVTRRPANAERVASILERDALATIANWLSAVKTDNERTGIPLSDEQRTGHLPKPDSRTCSTFACAAQSWDETGVGRCCHARQSSPLTGLFHSDDHRGIAYLAGQHFRYLADQPESCGFQPAPGRCNDHRGRM